MSIFDGIGKYIPWFKKLLEYLFEIKQSRTVSTQEVVLTFDKLTEELFYPKIAENREMTQVATTLVSEAATMIMMEFIDTRKAT